MNDVQTLNPIAFELGPISVHWYGIIIACGIILGLWIATREANRLGWDKEIITDFIMIAAPVAIICARIYYIAFEWDYYSQNPSQIIAIWQGGIAIHGALIGAVLTAIIFTRTKKLSFWKLTDIVAPSLILGQAIGRWGNFMNQEAHGGETTRAFLESIYLPNFIINQMFIDGNYYVPTFLYESSWDLLGFVILFYVLRKLNLKNGELFLSYLVWYSIGRFYVEGLRTDSLMLTSNLRIAQVVSLILIGISIILFLYRRRKIQTSG
ncbi:MULTISPECIES: prolipoprotein diacylglyceryl transferase [Niallia]|uniref:prolipoprotein diacylglyceryl transferase n=1 Tax=Niallia TaxID=2837506 RepID=UPI0015F478C9|nr:MULTISPECIES: prolipoprotein diacylglyceryl transferase [Niallia]UPO91224.1 prolipoprotein diacylglyceryl transferase [Niallia sp. Man26]GKU85125.1 prolipoprotein diacylglyceryl transferase [Niallia sp. NCCP-28]